MRGLSLYLSLLPLVIAGCKTSGDKRAESQTTPEKVAVRAPHVLPMTKQAQFEPTAPPPPPQALAVARSVSPEPHVYPDRPSFSITEEEVSATAPPATLPRQLQT